MLHLCGVPRAVFDASMPYIDRWGLENGDCDAALDGLKAKLAAKLPAPVWPPSLEDGRLRGHRFH